MPSAKSTNRTPKKGDSGSGAKKTTSGRGGGGPNPYRYQEAKWHTTDYKPPRKISDQELMAARKMFFELDRDASGSIDADELAFMLRSLGQNPTEQEIKDLIASVDEDGGDGDGKIQLREFLKLYTDGLDTKK